MHLEDLSAEEQILVESLRVSLLRFCLEQERRSGKSIARNTFYRIRSRICSIVLEMLAVEAGESSIVKEGIVVVVVWYCA